MLAATLLSFALLSSASAPDRGPKVDFGLPGLGGESIRLADYRGRWLVLNYWATWCAPCRKEIPELSALNEDRQDVTVLGLAFENADAEVFATFLEDFDVSYPILMVDVYDPPAPLGAPRVLPTTYILDVDGYLVKTFVGPVTREQIEQFVGPRPRPTNQVGESLGPDAR